MQGILEEIEGLRKISLETQSNNKKHFHWGENGVSSYFSKWSDILPLFLLKPISLKILLEHYN